MPKLFYLLLAFFGFLAGKIPGEDKVSQPDPFAGYSELVRSEADLDADGQTDRIIIYEKDCGELESSPSNLTRCRRMAIFLKREDSYKLFGYSDKMIGCSDCAEAGARDPFEGIRSGKGYFEFDTYYGECHRILSTYRFRYDAATADFLLESVQTEEYECKDPENPNAGSTYTKTMQTERQLGKVRFSDFEL